MPRNIDFERKGNTYEYEVVPIIREDIYYSVVRLPSKIAKEIKGKKVKVTIEPIEE